MSLLIMFSHIYSATLILASLSPTHAASCPAPDPSAPLQINTSSGLLAGTIPLWSPRVRTFLGVPFAQPPTGIRRWLPPAKLESAARFTASAIGPACPQQPLSKTKGLFMYSPTGGNQTQFFPPEDDRSFSEDCLTLNVWAPVASKEKLPVIVWFFGGGFLRGGTNSAYYNPESWVERTQGHIVVTVNFRSNIFGFPNADGLEDQNLGLLDQRLALEWVRDNIAKFGGYPSKIVGWGQSAGAIAVDYLNFAFPADPIFSGLILESGTASYPAKLCQSFDTTQANFSTVAKAMGCETASSPLDCLREAPWQDIQASIDELGLASSFLPIADERRVFSNYTDRSTKGAFSSAPAIIGTNQHEVNALIAPTSAEAANQTYVDSLTNSTFLCTAATAAQHRERAGRKTYRFRYDGDFANLSIPGVPGAYHCADLPLVFGTAGDYHGASTPFEVEVGKVMQDLWVQFANDPHNGLEHAGWDSYTEEKAVLLGPEEAAVFEITISQLEAVCPK